MPSSAELLIAAIALLGQTGAGYAPPGQGVPPAELDRAEGPRGTSGQQRDDHVGYLEPGDGDGVTVETDVLPPGSIAEVTELSRGTTILALVRPGVSGPGSMGRLSRGAAVGLGVDRGGRVPVRLRSGIAAAGEAAALSSGRAASPRMAAPPVLLTALRHRLPGTSPVPMAPPRRMTPAPRATPSPRPSPPVSQRTPAPRAASTPVPPRPVSRATPEPVASAGRFFVQIAALSDVGRARALASREHGRALAGGGLTRVQVGPFATRAAAQRARDDLVRRGYAGASIVAPDK